MVKALVLQSHSQSRSRVNCETVAVREGDCFRSPDDQSGKTDGYCFEVEEWFNCYHNHDTTFEVWIWKAIQAVCFCRGLGRSLSRLGRELKVEVGDGIRDLVLRLAEWGPAAVRRAT